MLSLASGGEIQMNGVACTGWHGGACVYLKEMEGCDVNWGPDLSMREDNYGGFDSHDSATNRRGKTVHD